MKMRPSTAIRQLIAVLGVALCAIAGSFRPGCWGVPAVANDAQKTTPAKSLVLSQDSGSPTEVEGRLALSAKRPVVTEAEPVVPRGNVQLRWAATNEGNASADSTSPDPQKPVATLRIVGEPKVTAHVASTENQPEDAGETSSRERSVLVSQHRPAAETVRVTLKPSRPVDAPSAPAQEAAPLRTGLAFGPPPVPQASAETQTTAEAARPAKPDAASPTHPLRLSTQDTADRSTASADQRLAGKSPPAVPIIRLSSNSKNPASGSAAAAPAPNRLEIRQLPPVEHRTTIDESADIAASPRAPSSASPAVDTATPPAVGLGMSTADAMPDPRDRRHLGEPVDATPRPASGPPVANAMSRTAPQIQQQIRYGFSLAGRGATYSARAELRDALKLVAMALDVDNGTTQHSRAYAAGMTALKEADDFATRDSEINLTADIVRLVASHETPVLKGYVTPATTPITALQSYYGYAQQQLAIAGGHEVAASMSLYGLARIQMVMGGSQVMSGPKAVLLHQTALMVDSRNYLAANELGVMLARFGQLDEAHAVLRHSATLASQPETWHNLAVVERMRGQGEAAERSQRYANELIDARRRGDLPDTNSASIVDWVDLATFAAANDEVPNPPSPQNTAAPAAKDKGSPPNAAAAPSGPWFIPQALKDLTARGNQRPPTTSRK